MFSYSILDAESRKKNMDNSFCVSHREKKDAFIADIYISTELKKLALREHADGNTRRCS